MQMACSTKVGRSFWSRRGTIITGVALAASLLMSGIARAQQFDTTPTAPGTSGDQLLFFYDTTPQHTTFLNVGNPSLQSSVTVEVIFYSEDFNHRLNNNDPDDIITIPGGGAMIVDPTMVPGVGQNIGLAVMTPIMSQSNHTPVVPPRPLVGGFTIVNLTLGAGFGDNAFGRLALVGPPVQGQQAPRANPGDAVDGQNVSYQGIQPTPGAQPSLTLAVYNNPTTLAPPENDGNRVLLAAFRDSYSDPVGPGNSARFNLRSTTNNTSVNFFNSSNGQRLVTDHPVSVSGVATDTLQSLSGDANFPSGGRLEFTLDNFNSAQESFFGFYGQSLGTFASGQRLIPVAP